MNVKKLTFAMAAFVAVLVALPAGSAQAHPAMAMQHSSHHISLYRPFPEGLPAHNARAAFKAVMGRAVWDDSYASTIAEQTGSAKFNPADYKPRGYASRAPAGTSNSGMTGQGRIVPLSDHNGSKYVRVFIIMNFATSKTVALMVRCGNPRLHPFVPVIPWHKFHLGTIIRINRTVSKPVSITCPETGQTVSGSLYASLKGWIKARTWGKVQGKLKLKLKLQYKLQLKAWVSLNCAPPAEKISIDIETVNDIPAGTCRPIHISVDTQYAPTGYVRIAPDTGSISTVDCYTPSSEVSDVDVNVAAGHTPIIVYVWAPNDAGTNSDTLRVKPFINGINADSNTATMEFTVSHPIRP